MPITALPEETIRTIGSSQVLTDSASVVKELIDNALDARASAVFIELSANALDVIQVKDNGFGIAPEDRALVCKRYCTSKIISYEDIANIGGSSLGFRGEALASAAQLSGSLVVTTKIEGETTATSLNIGRQGQVESEERASHPVGTTVRVVDFLKSLPVRRQTALKTTAKVVSTITRTLQAYALARPSVRFSLKILKAKNEKGNWTYAPKTSASVFDAATKVVGKKIVEQCRWEVWRSTAVIQEFGALEKDSDPNDDTFTIESLLASPGCDIPSIFRAGQFLSIDFRPVSCTRGVPKQIMALYKSYLRSACGLDSTEKISEPFLCMNIVCPEGSYDANIEPLKDDVLFSDVKLVLEIAESFFKSIYGELQPSSKAQSALKAVDPRTRASDVLLARKEQPTDVSSSKSTTPSIFNGSNDVVRNITDGHVHEASPDPSTQVAGNAGTENLIKDAGTSIVDDFSSSLPAETSTTELSTSSPTKPWRSNMYAANDDDEDVLFVAQNHHGAASQTVDAEEAGLRDIRISNPWSIAKANAPIRPRPGQQSTGPLPSLGRQSDEFGEAQATSPNTVAGDAQLVQHFLLTPEQSRRDNSDPISTSSSPERFPYPLAARGSRSGEYALASHKAANREHYGNRALDTWVQKSVHGCNETLGSAPEKDEGLFINPDTGNTRPRDFVSARTLPIGTPMSEITTAPTRRRRQSPQKKNGNGVHNPFSSPLTDDRVWFDTGQKPRMKAAPQDRPNGNQSTLTSQGSLKFPSAITPSPSSSPERPVHPDLALTLDYENRKTLAAQQHKTNFLQQKRQQLESEDNFIDRRSSNSPHQNRYNKAIAMLRQDEGAAIDGDRISPRKQSVFEAGDPRGYWMRLQEREQAAGGTSPSRPLTAKRRKTAMLPLETVREEWSVRELVLPLKTQDLPKLAAEAKQMGKWDEYVSCGKNTASLEVVATIDTVRAWEEQLQSLVQRTYKSDRLVLGGRGDLKMELWPVLREHWGSVVSSDGTEA